MTWNDLQALLKRPIAFQRVFATVGGSALNGLFLSQLYYWSDGRTSNPDGWLYKSQDEWHEETALTRYEQETARKSLRDKGILEEEKRGLPCRLYYRLNKARLLALINDLAQSSVIPTTNHSADKDGGNQQTGVGETSRQVRGFPTDKPGAFPHAITETTTETTPETTAETRNSPCVYEDHPEPFLAAEFSDSEAPPERRPSAPSRRPSRANPSQTSSTNGKGAGGRGAAPAPASTGNGIGDRYQQETMPDSLKHLWDQDTGEYVGPPAPNSEDALIAAGHLPPYPGYKPYVPRPTA